MCLIIFVVLAMFSFPSVFRHDYRIVSFFSIHIVTEDFVMLVLWVKLLYLIGEYHGLLVRTRPDLPNNNKAQMIEKTEDREFFIQTIIQRRK